MKTNSSPYTHTRTIRIREVSQLRPGTRGTRQWSIQITSGSYAATRKLIDPFTTTCEARLRWALEDHPSRFPFAGHKAQGISRELWGYAMSLMDQLNLPGVLSAVEHRRKKRKGGEDEELTVEAAMQGLKGKKWFLDIEGWGWGSGGEGSQDGCMNGIHWEALENPEVWPGNMRPLIVVRRRVPSADIVTRGPIVGIGSSAFRILVVVSHPMAENMRGTKTSNPRLVSRSLVDLVERLKADGSVPIYLEILRPASWKALEARLASGGKGFFHLIHFDVNARVTRLPRNETTATTTSGARARGKDEVSLSFVSEKCPQKRIWKATSDVSALLSLYNVKFVVLNAPRTAKAFGVVSSNFAESLVKSGVRAVVALPFRILNAGTEALMSTFYRCFLTETWDLAMALSEARRAMMSAQQREGRFGTMLPVDDWIVPVIYHNGATEVSVIGNNLASGSIGGSPKSDSKGFLSKFHGLLTSDHQRSPDSSILLEKSVSVTERTEAPGREYDIFKIEQLLDTTVLHVTGAPGVGKTKLMAHLSWWWKTTSFVHDAFYFDYDKQPSLTPEMALLKIYLQLFTTSGIEAHRKSSRGASPRPSVRESKASFLSQWSSSSRSSSPTSDASDGVGDDNWLEKTVEKLKEKRYLIVLDSLECSEAETKDDEVLKGEINEFLKMLQGGKSVVVVVGNKKESWLNDSLVKFGTYHLNRLEKSQAVELAESILEESAGDRRKFQNAENKYYLDMILQLCDFNPLVMELVLPKVAQNPSSPLTILLEALQGGISINHAPSIKPLRKLSSMLSRLDKDSKQLLLCLAPFYTRLPKDLNPYLHCLLYHKALPTTADASTMQILLNRPPSTHEKQRVKSILSSTGLLSRYSYIIRDLLSMDFLSEDSSSETYHVHPLLTLFLQQTVANEKERATSMYGVEYSLVTRAFLDYYSQRSFAWSQSPAETYLNVLDELECEEANFLSAMTIPLMHPSPAMVFAEFPVHAFARYAAVAAIQNSREKAELVAEICRKLLERAEEVGGDRGVKIVDEKVLVVAVHASTWLCEYYADADAIGAFKKQVEVSSGLLEFVEENASCLGELATLGEQCAVQKSVVVQGGMVDGLRFRKPWVGLLMEFRDPKKKKKEEDEAEWGRLAQDFIRLQSVAVQAPLTDRFTACMRERLKQGLSEIYQEVRAAVTCSPLRPFLQIYPWIPTSLLNPPSYNTILPRISAKPFLAYPSILQIHLTRANPQSTLSHLLSALNLARQHCDTALELPMHVLLAKHTFALRTYASTIAHVEYIHTLLPSTISSPNAPAAPPPHFPTLLHTTFLWGLSHNHLSQWTAASHAFLTALAISTHTTDPTTTYCTLRKLAAIKRESSIGPMTVTELLLRALDLAYSPDSPPPVFMEDRGALLQRIVSAMNSGCAGESRQAAIARFAAMRGKGAKEMGAFIDDVVALGKTIEMAGVEGGVPSEETERELKGMYAEAEGMLFKRPVTSIDGLTAIIATP